MPYRTYTLSVGDSKIIDDVMIYMRKFYSETTTAKLSCWMKLVVEQIGISRIKTRTTNDIYTQLIEDEIIQDTRANRCKVTAAADTLRKFIGTPEFIDYRTYEERFFEDV